MQDFTHSYIFDTGSIMRLKKGNKVEILSLKEVPVHSWRCAKIISGNGHTYQVQYDIPLFDRGDAIERVPRKAIRPCPPPIDSPGSLVPGDSVEVFENNSWSVAEVTEVAYGGLISVRILGATKVTRAHMSNIRLQQDWQDNKWVVIHQEPRKCDNGTIKGQSKNRNVSNGMPQSCLESRNCSGDGLSFAKKHYDAADYAINLKKRCRICLPPVEDGIGACRMIGTVKKEGRCKTMTVMASSKSLKKVNAVASPCKLLGGNYMNSSLNNNRATEFFETDSDWARPNEDRYFFLGSLDSNDSESVGSCSISSIPNESADHPVSSPTPELESQDDEVEAFIGAGRETSCSYEDLAAEVHRQELHAYKCTIMALYASGPLSWEKENLLTDLRLVLHISNDEHLLEANVGGLYCCFQRFKMMVGFVTTLALQTVCNISIWLLQVATKSVWNYIFRWRL
ncbi:uncharacterized protein LOC120253154 isoform X3 [Dioscorea cayenensis subsp. rotundata]|uniref:Uncharacterized protein LOC120253154 isoform X3 n=1 Tax=Dioscorea cayennensis subsp. rotundata TaxID=55577 RepID=A0AB40ARH7_DIOCR|nr:uncharacterized protein LOC120253154 isoform X3 [Dioscorea cayenensis subsp. rotundata]